MANRLKLLTGTANRPLADKIAQFLGLPLTACEVSRFSDGEIFVQINENVRGADVFIIQPTNPPAENLMELLILIEASRRASAATITAVLPYYGYSRQDRKDQPRVAITAKLVANLITVAGADRVITMDLHASQIQGFFDIPSDHLYASSIFNRYFLDLKLPDPVVISPDVGAIRIARAFAKKLDAGLAIIDKRRPQANQAEILNIIGDVEGKTAIIRDDMADTAGTIVQAAEVLSEKGAKAVYACATHPVLSGPALERIGKSKIKKFVVADTIDLSAKKLPANLEVLSSAPLFGESILRISRGESVSSLFD
ncbi:MAG: ribose-phosphate pyrophosphokinase [candidate division Zixibacteria bacterium]|nr:ribose-phosphate pyrophosphokinase [candidate division Zixibacteria bacterium]MCI0596316.1 ribose-phosphate pyrophosphokinase [candidate division Zixibacteria bacterium]